MTAVQLDLFGEVEAAERQAADADRARIDDALTCLAISCPHALEVLWHLEWWKPRDEKGPGFTEPWAYLVCRRGVFFEHESTWGGWDCRPRNLVTWDELRDRLADDPRRAGVVAWATGLWHPTAADMGKPWPDLVSWRYLIRPYELDPHPEMWNPSYAEGDREARGYADRMGAWRTTMAILLDHRSDGQYSAE